MFFFSIAAATAITTCYEGSYPQQPFKSHQRDWQEEGSTNVSMKSCWEGRGDSRHIGWQTMMTRRDQIKFNRSKERVMRACLHHCRMGGLSFKALWMRETVPQSQATFREMTLTAF